jgi:3-methylcrotonyl-CoA carboxylase beta subunit
VREVIARIVDGSRVRRVQGATARRWSRLRASARLSGRHHRQQRHPVLESALKGAHFIELCNQRGIPLVFLQNITGFMVGKQVRGGGIAKDGAKMVTPSRTRVPKFTVIIGGSFGAGNYGMCGRAYEPRFLWMWPNARISVMGGEQAARACWRRSSATASKSGKQGRDRSRRVVGRRKRRPFKAPIREQYERAGQSAHYYATARLWDDGVIRRSSAPSARPRRRSATTAC